MSQTLDLMYSQLFFSLSMCGSVSEHTAIFRQYVKVLHHG